MVRKTALALALAIPSPCMAQDEAWASIGMSGKSEMFADFGSVVASPPQQFVREFAVRKFWVKADHSADKSTRARRSLFYVAIDCDGRRYQFLQEASYSADGEILASNSGPDAGFAYRAIIPGSIMMEARKWICDLPAREEK